MSKLLDSSADLITETVDLVIIGAGPAGLAAAIAAWDQGVRKMLLVERDTALGGILNQCIHNGFGLQRFREELTGPEYAERDIDEVLKRGIPIALDTTVLDVSAEREVHLLSPRTGYRVVKAGAVVLAMGARERARGAIGTPGTRPSGVLTAGSAQRYINLEGLAVGKRVVILGSGDIGLIMARRLSLEGAEVLACVEIMAEPGGLRRNIVQCLDDFGIPLLLSHTISEIEGTKRVEAVRIAKVDTQLRPIPGTERRIECDTVLLSVGLIPENELSRLAGVTLDNRTKGPLVSNTLETSVPGIFACGNVLHIHDLVDNVSAEAARAGEAAARFLGFGGSGVAGAIVAGAGAGAGVKGGIPVIAGTGIRYTVPQTIREIPSQLDIFFRVTHTAEEQKIVATSGGRQIAMFRKLHVAPGEMEKITLSRRILADIDPAFGLKLTMEGA